MSSPPVGYRVVSQVHVNKWIAELQRAVPGWEVTVRDNVTATVVPVFVDDEHYTAGGVAQAIEAALAPVREVHSLGS